MRISDVHRTQISSYERGETEPQAEVLARLSRALGVSVDEVSWGHSMNPRNIRYGRFGLRENF